MSDSGTSASGLVEDRSGGDVPAGLAERLSEMARDLQAEPNKDEVMQTVVEAAVANVAGAEYAGITLVTSRGEFSTPAKTDELVATLDQLQSETGDGPCLTSAREHHTVRSDDLSHEQRWPNFSARAAAAGVGSMLCLQLFVHEGTLGALNLYARQPRAFDEQAEDVGLLLASHAAIAMVGADREGNLRIALGSRDVIGQAKGILMERHKISAHEAFQVLIRASQENNRKLSVIAQLITTTGLDPTREAVRNF